MERISVKTADVVLGEMTHAVVDVVVHADLLPGNDHADNEDPFFPVFCRKGKAVRTFADSFKTVIAGFEFTGFVPFFKIMGGIEFYMVAGSQYERVTLSYRVPENLGVPEIFLAGIGNDGIPIIFLKMFIIRAVGQTLMLHVTLVCAVMGEKRQKGRGVPGSEAGKVLPVIDTGTGKYAPEFVRIQCNGKMVPMQKIFGNRMTPVHRTPVRSCGVVLIKEMVPAVYIYHTVWVVDPVFGRSKVNRRPVIVSLSGFWNFIHVFLRF